MIDNPRYNRRESANGHEYYLLHGYRDRESNEHTGYLKAKLVHGLGYSIVCPEFIFLGTDGRSWIQPFQFFPPILGKFSETDIRMTFLVDITLGHTLRLEVRLADFVQILPDQSILYKCKIYGPTDIDTLFTGVGEIHNGIPFVELYHHTLPASCIAISQSRFLRGSAWNIQGNKQLLSTAYCYLTPIDSIKYDVDLKTIAMASDGKLHLLADNAPQPTRSTFQAAIAAGQVLELDVYRSSTRDRSATLKLLVPAHYVAPPHLLCHSPSDSPVYYEIISPFIHRIPVPAGGQLTFDINMRAHDYQEILYREYIIVGDARTAEGLRAPFDEENTSQIFKIEPMSGGREILAFWFENPNSDQFSGKKVSWDKFSS